MIRKNLINCKLFLEKRPIKYIYADCLSHLHVPGEVCPYCSGRDSLHVHGYYKRTLIDFVNNKPVKTVLFICRFICNACMHPSTHAILPDPIIPYCRHSLRFILRVLIEHFFHLRPVEKICEAYEISVRTFYRWQKLFEENRKEWQHLLNASVKDLKASLLTLIQRKPYSTFSSDFIHKTGFSLLQSHKNPPFLAVNDPFQPNPHMTT